MTRLRTKPESKQATERSSACCYGTGCAGGNRLQFSIAVVGRNAARPAGMSAKAERTMPHPKAREFFDGSRGNSFGIVWLLRYQAALAGPARIVPQYCTSRLSDATIE